MNASQVPSTPPHKAEPSSPRPPPVGKETRTFCDIFAQPGKETSHPEKPSVMATAQEVPSPCPARRWAQGLSFLLDDHHGSTLFREFLNQEGHETLSLDFWFGAKGIKDIQTTPKVIHVLYYKLVHRIPLIRQATKDEIMRKISSGGVLGVDIFDAAQQEVEDYMRRTTYPNFLKSDLYIQQLQGVCPTPVEEIGGDLQTLHEDREYNFSVRRIDFRSLFRNPKKNRANAKSKTEAQAAFLKSPSAPYHTTYAPFLPASARDSEVQSLSSGVQTDDAMSQSNSSMSDPNAYRKQRYQQKQMQPFLNKDVEAEKGYFCCPCPRTTLPDEAMIHTRPQEFVKLLTERLEKAQKDLAAKETFTKKLESIEPSNTAVKSVPRQNIPYIPDEENDQSILDRHLERVFPGKTPTPGSPACATPSATTAVKCDPRLQAAPWCAPGFTPENSTTSPWAGRIVKRDGDMQSHDSGLADWIEEDKARVAHTDYHEARRARERMQRSQKVLPGSSTSFFDSGVSMACESVQLKATNSQEPRRPSEAENDRRGKNSPDLARSSVSRKATVASYSYSSRFVPEPSQWPVGQPGDPPSHGTTASLRETRRILEDEMRNKSGKSKYVSTGRNSHEATRGKVSSRACDTSEDGLSHRKQSKKSTGSSSGESTSTIVNQEFDFKKQSKKSTGSLSGESTIVGYSYGLGSTPFKSKLEGRNPTLKQFKTLLNKRGNFRYFFKSLSDDFGTTLVYDEVTDDHALLPLWEGKVFCVIEAMDDQGGERTAPWSQEEIKL